MSRNRFGNRFIFFTKNAIVFCYHMFSAFLINGSIETNETLTGRQILSSRVKIFLDSLLCNAFIYGISGSQWIEITTFFNFTFFLWCYPRLNCNLVLTIIIIYLGVSTMHGMGQSASHKVALQYQNVKKQTKNVFAITPSASILIE